MNDSKCCVPSNEDACYAPNWPAGCGDPPKCGSTTKEIENICCSNSVSKTDGKFICNSPPASICQPDNTKQSWVWSPAVVQEKHSCIHPPTQNIGQMCINDVTSILLDVSKTQEKGIGCYLTNMNDCVFNLRDFVQIDFDIVVSDCENTWFSFWATPRHHWTGDGLSGEMDFIESCPINGIHSNWAGGGVPDTLSNDTSSFTAHMKVTINQTTGKVEIYKDGVKTKAKYDNIFASYACTNDNNCNYVLKADIWNGYDGDGGYDSCMKNYKNNPQPSNCKFSIKNIRLTPKDPNYKFSTEKCNALLPQSETMGGMRSAYGEPSNKPSGFSTALPIILITILLVVIFILFYLFR